MSAAAILVSDRPDRSAAIAEPLGRVVPFDVVGPDERWSQRAGVRVVVVDLDLGRLESTTCLNRLQNRLGAPGLNVIVLLGPNDQGRTVQARTLGATLCLPRANATDVMLPFLRKHFGVEVAASPTAPATAPPSEAQRRTEAGVRQAESALACLIGARGRSGTLDLGPVESSLDPIVDALREGGLARWVETVRAYDDVTFQHCLLVAGLCARFALHLGFGERDRQRFVRAALVHDVGKARIPLAILNKPGRLDPDELAVMRTHAPLGYDMLVAAGERDPLTLDAVRHHHEALDGSGYPDKLSSEAISDLVRLLTICDIHAALIEKRPYKKPLPHDEALSILSGMRDKVEIGLLQSFNAAVRYG